MSELDSAAVEQVLGGIRIPAQPETLQKIMDEVNKSAPDMDYIADLVASDMGLSAAVLKIINSPMYALRSEISSIKQAATLLGVGNITPLVNGYFLKSAMTDGKDQATLKMFWDAASTTAATMAMIAPKVADIAKDDAYTFGLFSRCGIPVLMQKVDDYRDLVFMNKTASYLSDAETSEMGANHAQIGSFISKKWCLPAHISSAIASLDELDDILNQKSAASSDAATMVVCLNLAEHMAYSYLKLDWLHDGAESLPNLLAFLGLSELDYDDLCDDIFEKLSYR